jgi:hypothetical protein
MGRGLPPGCVIPFKDTDARTSHLPSQLLGLTVGKLVAPQVLPSLLPKGAKISKTPDFTALP